MVSAYFGQPTGQGWTQIGELAVALILSAAIGIEREIRQKSAGLRTHTLVGVAAVLIMLVSTYGFVVTAGHFLVVLAFTPVAARLPRSKYALSRVRLTYLDGRGVLRLALAECTRRDFTVGELSIEQRGEDDQSRTVSVWLSVQGSGSITDLTATLTDIDGILAVSSDDATPAPP